MFIKEVKAKFHYVDAPVFKNWADVVRYKKHVGGTHYLRSNYIEGIKYHEIKKGISFRSQFPYLYKSSDITLSAEYNSFRSILDPQNLEFANAFLDTFEEAFYKDNPHSKVNPEQLNELNSYVLKGGTHHGQKFVGKIVPVNESCSFLDPSEYYISIAFESEKISEKQEDKLKEFYDYLCYEESNVRLSPILFNLAVELKDIDSTTITQTRNQAIVAGKTITNPDIRDIENITKPALEHYTRDPYAEKPRLRIVYKTENGQRIFDMRFEDEN